MENKQSEDKIIEALKLCSAQVFMCDICSYNDKCHILKSDALNLIDCLKAEIERLQTELYQFANIGKLHSEVKAEAIKEFAEMLRRTIVDTPFVVNCSGESEDYKDGCLHGLVAKQHNILDVLDNLLKEMVDDG